MNPTTIGVPVAWVVHLVCVVPPDPELLLAPPLGPPVVPTVLAPEGEDAPLDDPPDALPPDGPELDADPSVTAVWPVPLDPVEPLGRPFDETGWPAADGEPEFADTPPLMVF